MQIRVYYNPDTDTGTRTRVNVNAPLPRPVSAPQAYARSASYGPLPRYIYLLGEFYPAYLCYSP